MTKSKARIHHYISQFYLSGFSISVGSKANIHIHDITRKKYFKTTPRNIASKRDFNRIEIEGEENSIEEALAGFESEASHAFRNIRRNQKLPNNDGFSFLLNFICLLSLRNPSSRESFGNFQKQIAEMILDMVVSKKEIYESQIKKLKQETGIDHDVSYEQMKAFVENKRYRLEIPTGNFVLTELTVFNKILPLFFKRNWSFIWSNKEVGEFVSSDHPVSLISLSHSGPSPVGFGIKKTEVAFPISRFVAMIGVFEDTYPPEIPANESIVANINGRTVNFAKDQIYSAHREFFYLDRDGRIKNSSQLF